MPYEFKFNKDGNIKLGGKIWSANKLAGAGYLNGCKGTCGEHCKGCYNPDDPKKSDCYVFSSYRHYGWEKSTVVAGHIRNTNVMRNDINKAFDDINKQVTRARKKPDAIRIHSSGEFESVMEIIMWDKTARANPGTPFYVYTKAYDLVDAYFFYLAINNTDMPQNFWMNISVWHDIGIDCYNRHKNCRQIRAFVYDDGYDYGDFKFDCHCPAYKENGKMDHAKTCSACKICYQSKCKICACHDH